MTDLFKFAVKARVDAARVAEFNHSYAAETLVQASVIMVETIATNEGLVTEEDYAVRVEELNAAVIARANDELAKLAKKRLAAARAHLGIK